jgi:hypothetical protein
MMKKPLILFAAAVFAAAAAPAAPMPVQEHHSTLGEREVSIPFASFRNVRDFHPVSRGVVYLQDRSRNWYRATLAFPCLDLPWAHRIGIDTNGGNNVDQFSSLIVGRERCRIASLVRSGPPPKKAKNRPS